MSEIVTAETWLYETLKATAPTSIGGPANARIYSGVVPQSVSLPAVVYQNQAGEDLTSLNHARVWVDGLWLVKVIGQVGDFADLQPIADWIDFTVHKMHGGANGGKVVSCVRERPFAYIEHDGAVQYRHLGGIYRLLAR